MDRAERYPGVLRSMSAKPGDPVRSLPGLRASDHIIDARTISESTPLYRVEWPPKRPPRRPRRLARFHFFHAS